MPECDAYLRSKFWHDELLSLVFQSDVRSGSIPDLCTAAKCTLHMPNTFGLPSTADMALRRANWRYTPRAVIWPLALNPSCR
jgi:hypothetical protein